jgi:hypothetical protein
MFFTRTIAVIDKAIHDLTRLLFVVSIVVQITFIGLYGFKIWINWNQTVYLVLYCILTGLSLLGFAYYLITHHHKTAPGVRGKKRIIRIAKYAANFGMLIVNLVSFALNGASDLDIALSLVATLFFFGEILIEIVLVYYERYAELLKIALGKDLESLKIFAHPKNAILSAIDSPLESWANPSTGSEKTPDSPLETQVETLAEDYQAKHAGRTNEETRNQKAQIKAHLHQIGNIFKEKLFHAKNPKSKDPNR